MENNKPEPTKGRKKSRRYDCLEDLNIAGRLRTRFRHRSQEQLIEALKHAETSLPTFYNYSREPKEGDCSNASALTLGTLVDLLKAAKTISGVEPNVTAEDIQAFFQDLTNEEPQTSQLTISSELPVSFSINETEYDFQIKIVTESKRTCAELKRWLTTNGLKEEAVKKP